MTIRVRAGVPIGGAVRAAPPIQLHIGYIGQGDYDQLCWAACCAMVLQANGADKNILDVANAVTGRPCSADPKNSPCNIAVDPAAAWSGVNVPYSVPAPNQGAIAQDALSDQIANGRKPVQVFWSYTGGGGTGHVILVVGWDATSSTFGVYDPLRRPQWVTYLYLKSAGGAGWWGQTYYAIGGRLG